MPFDTNDSPKACLFKETEESEIYKLAFSPLQFQHNQVVWEHPFGRASVISHHLFGNPPKSVIPFRLVFRMTCFAPES